MVGHPDFGPITMRYEDGGRVEIYQMGKLSVRVPSGSMPDEIRAAFDAETKK
jgi:hypothetical protein